ncbi:uncharacterized protein LOC127283945 isoform X2 [Leptopilina boulardi]|uniref:uncharacterized protein LOC127283945 isoform X2 n=1 Tax=Leptopilina boulardi TaxID=63433 RepID=UPI0021F577CE|nr:uncharacterized protein LOC127283945 isoform X2 [Leptopilina boulardi]
MRRMDAKKMMCAPANSTLESAIEQNLYECRCAHYDCGCCNHIELDYFKVNGTFCSDMKYLPNDIGVSMTITYNNMTFYNETISVRNPPKICPIIIEEFHIEACVRFYDMDFDRHHFNGCAEVDISFLRALPLMKKDLGCFHMGHQNSTNSIPYTVMMVK